MSDIMERLRLFGEKVSIPCPDNIKGCLVAHYRVEPYPVCADAADEIERLQKAEQHILKMLELSNQKCHARNREIERLRAENERLREALSYYAENHYPNVDDGPWGAGSNDFGDVARAALEEKTS